MIWINRVDPVVLQVKPMLKQTRSHQSYT